MRKIKWGVMGTAFTVLTLIFTLMLIIADLSSFLNLVLPVAA